jgi:multimeric flavodoxin WrbA
MKIVAVMGSPKGKGSGYKVVRMIEDRMKAMGNAEFAYIFLKDADLRPCTGCYVCMKKGEEKCPLKDDRAAIEQQLLEADGIILSTPLYVDNVSGLMKNFFDRFAYAIHRPRFFHQKVLTVVNTGGGNPKPALEYLRHTLVGPHFVHELGIVTPQWPQTESAVAKKEQAIDVAAQKLYQACLDTSLPLPTFSQYQNFLVMQKLSSVCREYLPRDFEYYNGKDYYYDTHIHPFKAAFAKAVVRVMFYMWKELGPGNVKWPPTE